MNQKERVVISGILLLVLILVGVDLFTDAKEGIMIWHMTLEGVVGLVVVFGIFYLLKDSFQTKHRLENEIRDFSEFKKQADVWKQESKKYIDGLSKAIYAKSGVAGRSELPAFFLEDLLVPSEISTARIENE